MLVLCAFDAEGCAGPAVDVGEVLLDVFVQDNSATSVKRIHNFYQWVGLFLLFNPCRFVCQNRSGELMKMDF